MTTPPPTTPLPRREDVPDEKKWSVETVFPTPDAWEAAFAEVDAALAGFAELSGRLGESPGTLRAALERRDTVDLAAGRVGLYAGMLRSGDTGNQTFAALSSRAQGLVRAVCGGDGVF